MSQSNDGWEPWATAPTDGSMFDAWIVMPDGDSYRAPDCRWSPKYGEFINRNGHNLYGCIPVATGVPKIYPSHWRRIADPPPLVKPTEAQIRLCKESM